MIRSLLAVIAISLALPALPQEAATKPSPWFPVPQGAEFTTGDTWRVSGETHRLYGVQACIRGTQFTNAKGVKLDCGEASLTMLVSLIRDLKPQCYTTGWRAETKTRLLICVAQPSQGAGAGSRIDLGTALISMGWAFAALNPDGRPVHAPYLVAQAVAEKQKTGLWEFPDTPDPNAIILRQLRASGSPAPGVRSP